MSNTIEKIRVGNTDYDVGVSSWNDLTDKPFGENKTEILPLSDMTFIYDAENAGAMAQVENTVPLTANDTLEIIWDGTAYSCSMSVVYGMTVFGNLSAVGMVDTGEPFYGVVQDGAIALVDTAAQADVKRSVSISAVSVNTIPPKYLGFTVTTFYFTNDDDDPYLYSDAAATTKATADELSSATARGIIVVKHNVALGQFSVTSATVASNYWIIGCHVGDAIKTRYTAEYTPS